MKVYIIKIDEGDLTGCGSKILIVGVHKKKPTKKLLNEYAKEWECNVDYFKVDEQSLRD